MAYKLIWSPAARDDLHDIVSFISRDSRHRAETFGYRLITETDRLQTSPKWAELCLNITFLIHANSLLDLTGLSIAFTSTRSSSRLRECGTRQEAPPNY